MRLVVGDTRELARLRFPIRPPLLLPDDVPRAVRIGVTAAPAPAQPSMPPWLDRNKSGVRSEILPFSL